MRLSIPCLVLFCLSSIPAAKLQAQAAHQEAPDPKSPGRVAEQNSPKADDKSSDAVAKPDYSKEPSVTEQMHAQFRFESDGTGREAQFIRIRVQSEAGVQRWGQLRFGYSSASERLDIESVRVIKQDGSIVTAGPDAVQELTSPIQGVARVFTDYREKHVTVPGLRPGDVLEFKTVQTIHTALAPNQFWMQYDFQQTGVVLDEQLDVDIPSSRTVKLKTKPGFDPKITEAGGRRIYHWSSSKLIVDDEKDKDAKKKNKKKSDDEIPSVQMTTFASWEEVGRWYAGLEKDRRIPSPAVRAKAAELTKGLSTDTDKVQALYDYTAKNFRYVSLSLGIGRYQPHSAEEVLHNEYGDCKDKSTLLDALLDAEGFRASTVLMNSVRKVDPDVPSPSQFNHAITVVTVGKEQVWMDTTAEVAPFGLIAYNLRKKKGLIVPPDGAPSLIDTPANSPITDSEIWQIDGTVDDSGTLDAKVSFEVRGDSEIYLRQAFRLVPSTKWQEAMGAMSAREGLGKDVSEIRVSDPTVTREPFTLSYRVKKAGYVDPSKKKLNLKLPIPTLGPPAASEDDADGPDPLELGPPKAHDYRMKLVLPAKYAVRTPISSSLKRDYGNFKATYTLEGTTLTAERQLNISERELPPARTQDYLAFRRGVLTDTAQTFSLETAVVSAPSLPSGTKIEDLIRNGNDERRNGHYGTAIELLNRAVELDPKHKSAWNDLGLAYLESRLDELAINAFQRQIEVSPYNAFAYNNLGRVYLRQRKYDDAVKWFNKQIEIDPLDKFAHGNLGMVYLERHQYDQALPELDKAASLTPNSAEAQVRLGEAYLNLSEDEKAMHAFDEALRISASAGIWNSIAYQLALKKVHLDLARRYAESAVTTTAAALRNVTLDQPSAHDLTLVSSIAAYWDTLGWVEFVSGSPDKALKYCLAGWQAGQQSEIADHLGQMYEKQRNKKDAMRFYALSLNARRPDPETRTRLAALAGGDEKVDALIAKYRDELPQALSFKLNNPAKQYGKADFLMLLSNGSAGEASVEAAKFVSGKDNLKDFADVLRKGQYSQRLPDETPLKLVRRGTLTCTEGTSNCTLQLVLPEDVKSAD